VWCRLLGCDDVWGEIRLQFFRFIEHDGVGGESMFVDGFQIASQIQEEDPDVMNFLTKRPFQFQYLEDGVMLFSHKCLLRLDPITGQIQQFSFNNDDRFGEWIDQEEVCFSFTFIPSEHSINRSIKQLAD